MSQLALQLFTMHQFKCIYHFQNSTISGEIGKTMGFNYQCMTQVLKIALPRCENKGIKAHIPEPSPNLIVAETINILLYCPIKGIVWVSQNVFEGQKRFSCHRVVTQQVASAIVSVQVYLFTGCALEWQKQCNRISLYKNVI